MEVDRRHGLDRTLVVVTADHGEEFFEHGNKGHQKSLIEEVVRVPMIVRWPERLPAGLVVEDQVRHIDLVPTLLSLSGIESPEAIEGRDISPLLRGESMPQAPVLMDLQVFDYELFGMRTNERKFLTFPTKHFWQYGYQHYDLENDLPAEPGSSRIARTAAAGLSCQVGTIQNPGTTCVGVNCECDTRTQSSSGTPCIDAT